MKKNTGNKLIAQNKKAYHEYFISETFQAGISLVGTEVKSMRAGKCSLKESYIKIVNGEAIIFNMHISHYEQGSFSNLDSLRQRKLLLHKREISKLHAATKLEGYTIMPLKAYLLGSYIKLDVGLAKGKKLYDKRETIAKKDAVRDMERAHKARANQ